MDYGQLVPKTSWVRVVLGTSCLGYELSKSRINIYIYIYIYIWFCCPKKTDTHCKRYAACCKDLEQIVVAYISTHIWTQRNQVREMLSLAKYPVRLCHVKKLTHSYFLEMALTVAIQFLGRRWQLHMCNQSQRTIFIDKLNIRHSYVSDTSVNTQRRRYGESIGWFFRPQPAKTATTSSI